MSRSRRKNPVFGITTCRSEKQDKKLWHGRWRANERTSLASADPEKLESHLPVPQRQVSNPWIMGKDGRQRWPLDSQERFAKDLAESKGRTEPERRSLAVRLLRKWMGK